MELEMNPFSLAFRSPQVEGEFLQEVANRRWPVLMWVFAFDVFCFMFRFIAKLTVAADQAALAGGSSGRPFEVVQEMGHQLANMAMLYVLIGLLNKRARTAGNNAARQEEVLLSICMGLAICNLLASLRTDNAQDYVYVSFFLICTSTFLKIRWWVGTGLLATPMVAVQCWYASPAPSALLPPDALVHIFVAWAVGGLMAYLSDWYRRQMYANARLACAAHEKEMMEATARIQAQRELAAAQAQAAQRALTVAREKAAHEAKSEFMSLMCHEVRTPLNGCLASAEMLLETPLKEEQRELANTIRVSGSILLSTVSNFLDFFKLEAGKRLDIVRSEVVPAHLVGDVHCIIEAMIGKGGPVALQPPQLAGVPEVRGPTMVLLLLLLLLLLRAAMAA
ncbi:hypothetical protein OEZ85_003803 [Tetradesmus obliquus]|uniref:histidine kinase n=2 Tax=Tetradesmus obliquus TaxID=3088 RepID=A0ABY8UG93_TETOB|nr:hypothetical protein OEZ85_003803 [Tetradesmus obliquus]